MAWGCASSNQDICEIAGSPDMQLPIDVQSSPNKEWHQWDFYLGDSSWALSFKQPQNEVVNFGVVERERDAKQWKFTPIERLFLNESQKPWNYELQKGHCYEMCVPHYYCCFSIKVCNINQALEVQGGLASIGQGLLNKLPFFTN